jgi:hypothetical protein
LTDSSSFEAEIAIVKFKKCKFLGSDEIPAEIIQAGGKILLSAIHKLMNSIYSKEELTDHLKKSIITSIYKKGGVISCKYTLI